MVLKNGMYRPIGDRHHTDSICTASASLPTACEGTVHDQTNLIGTEC